MKMLIGAIGQPVSVLDLCVRIAMSIAIGSIIGFERERKNRPAGLRTHVLVCMASSLIAIVEQQMVYEVANLASDAVNISIGRLSVGVITGIGFIGAGTIMMSKSKIVGLTTAASLWCTACLGLVNGMGFSLVAIIAAVVVIFALQFLRLGERTRLNRIVEIMFIDDETTLNSIEGLLETSKLNVRDSSVAFHREQGEKICTIRYSIVFKDKTEIRETMSNLSEINNVTEVKLQNVM